MAYWNRKNTVKNLIGLCLLPWLMFFLLRWFEHRQVYFPSRSFRGSAESLARPWEDAYFQTADGQKINGWFFPARTNSPRAHLAVLLCHGNAGNIGDRLGLYEVLLAAGVNVFAFDYRGYGRSTGRPSESRTYLDAQAAYDWLRIRGIAGANIIALGESLGGGVAGELAVRVPLRGLILQSTFTSIPDLGAELFPWLPVRTLSTIRYDTLAKLPRIRIPILVMHSRSDSLVGFHHGQKLFASANEPKTFCELEGDHNEALSSGLERYREGLDRFLASLEKPGTKTP